MKKIIEILKNLGFEEREIKIYLTLIRNESLTALKISKETRIDRTTVYDILERLIDKGIVSFIIKNKTKHYNALSPEKLLVYFNEKYVSLKNIIPDLKIISNIKKEETKFEVFQGLEGIKSILKDLVNTKKRYQVIGFRKEYEDLLSYFNEHSIKKLDSFKVEEKAILPKGEKIKKLEYGKYKYIEKGFLSPITTLIYDNKVAFFIWTEPEYAMLIQNDTFVKGYREYFDLLWKIAKR